MKKIGLMDWQQAGLLDYWIRGLLGWEAVAERCMVALLHRYRLEPLKR